MHAVSNQYNNIGSLSDLTTTDKSSVVGAINEVNGASPIKSAVSDGTQTYGQLAAELSTELSNLTHSAVLSDGTVYYNLVSKSSFEAYFCGASLDSSNWSMTQIKIASTGQLLICNNGTIQDMSHVAVPANHGFYLYK